MGVEREVEFKFCTFWTVGDLLNNLFTEGWKSFTYSPQMEFILLYKIFLFVAWPVSLPLCVCVWRLEEEVNILYNSVLFLYFLDTFSHLL